MERFRLCRRGRARSSGRPLRQLMLSIGVLAMLALAGCGAAPSSTPSVSHPTALNYALAPQTDINWYPPLIPANNCGSIAGGVYQVWEYQPLFMMNNAAQIDYHDSIAQSVTHNAKGTQYVIKLNPKWHWADGAPVTSQDVVYWFTLAKAASAANAPLFYCYAGTGGVPNDYQSVVATSKYTVTVTTTQPVNPEWFIYNSLAQFIPLPKAKWDHSSNMTTELKWINAIANQPSNPIYQDTDGAYLFKAAKTDQYYEYVANPHWDGSPKPTIKTVYFDYETSYSSIFTALKKGTVQIAPYDTSLWKDKNQLTNDTLLSTPQYGFYYGLTNFASDAQTVGPLFQNLYIRQALQDGIDQPAIISDFYHGQATPTYTPVPTTSSWYDKTLKNPYPYDPAKGKALLEAHGWKMVNGVMTKNGQKLAFQALLPTGDQTITNMAELVKADWAKEGIDITLKELSPDALYSLTGASLSTAPKWTFAFDAGWFYSPDYFPSGDGLVTQNGGYNFDYYDYTGADTKMTALINALTQPATLAQTKQAFYQYEEYAAQQLPMLYFPTATALTAVSKSLGGVTKNYNDVYTLVNVNDLYWK